MSESTFDEQEVTMAITAPEIDPRIAAQALKSEAYLSAVISQHDAELEGQDLDDLIEDEDEEEVGIAVLPKKSETDDIEVGTSSSSRRDSGMEEQSAGGSVQNADPPPYAPYSDVLNETASSQGSKGREKPAVVSKTSSMKNGALTPKMNGINSNEVMKKNRPSAVVQRHSSVPRNINRVQRNSSGVQSIDRKLRRAAHNGEVYGIPRHSGSLSDRAVMANNRDAAVERAVPDDDPPAYSDFRNGLQGNQTVTLTDL